MAGQGSTNGSQVSLSAHICGRTSLEDVSNDIESLIGQLCEAEIETDTATDVESVQRAIIRERRLRFNLDLLKNVRSEKVLARHMSSITSLVNEAQASTCVKLQQLERQINVLVSRVEVNNDVISSQVDALEEQLEEVNETVRESEGRSKELHQSVSNLSRGLEDLQRTVDVIDNRQRARNAVLYGLSGDRPDKQIKKLLGAHSSHLLQSLETAHYIGKGRVRPALLRFQTVSSKEAFIDLARTKVFKEANPRLSVASDQSFRARVGMSRLAAAAPELRSRFPGITIKRDQVFFKGKRYPAADFTSPFIRIDHTLFDVTRAAQ
jgi:predicted RNase H-like nuclease (RuvC/YqgF family)